MFVVSKGVKIWGTLHSPEGVRVEGLVDGCLIAERVEVSATGTVTGDLISSEVRIAGRVHGDVYADKLTLAEGCHVEGAIYHRELVLQTGATFEGQSRRYDEPRKLAPAYDLSSG